MTSAQIKRLYEVAIKEIENLSAEESIDLPCLMPLLKANPDYKHVATYCFEDSEGIVLFNGKMLDIGDYVRVFEWPFDEPSCFFEAVDDDGEWMRL